MSRPSPRIAAVIGAAAILIPLVSACSSDSKSSAPVTVTKTAESSSESTSAPASSVPSVSALPSTASAPASSQSVAPKKTKKPVSLSWTTISRSSGSGAKKTAEKLEVPYLTNATSKANKAFNAGVSRAVASWRGEVAPLPGADCNEVGMCPLAMDRIDGGIYEQRYASALTSIYVWTGGAHGLTDSFGLTVDLQTGDSVGLDTFVKAPDSVVNAAVGRALLNKLPADETQGQTPNVDIRQDGVAWSVSDKGVSFAFAEGLVASNAQGLVSVTVPWNEVQG